MVTPWKHIGETKNSKGIEPPPFWLDMISQVVSAWLLNDGLIAREIEDLLYHMMVEYPKTLEYTTFGPPPPKTRKQAYQIMH